MKEPRLEAFDTRGSAKKKPYRGDLSLHSPLDDMPKIEPPKAKRTTATEENNSKNRSNSQTTEHLEKQEESSKLVSKETSFLTSKYTSKLVNDPTDPVINKVGYYLTRREIDRLNALLTELKPIMRDKHNIKVTKNDIIRACLAIGIRDWEENQLTSELTHLLTN